MFLYGDKKINKIRQYNKKLITLLPVAERECVVSSGLKSLVVTDGDSECAAGVVVSESVDVCMSL